MAEEEVKYTIPYQTPTSANGSEVDITFTYDASNPNPDGSYTVTAVAGTYETLGPTGNVIDTDTITGLDRPGLFEANDNELFIPTNPTTTPIVTGGGISFTISSTADSNDSMGNVNFHDVNGLGAGPTAPTDTPAYHEEGHNGNPVTSISETAVCFAGGTFIRTTAGDVAVEDLRVGDIVITASGEHRPIKWLGHRAIDCRLHVRPHEVNPVRIAANAFGPNRPARDLYLSPGHPVLVGIDEGGRGGHLVPIMCLINGTTIERVVVDEVTYWHVELDLHDILLAEGLPAESYIDLGSRPWFAGADGVLYDPDLALVGQPGRCRPVAIDGAIVEEERRRLDSVFAARLAGACAWPDGMSMGLNPNAEF